MWRSITLAEVLSQTHAIVMGWENTEHILALSLEAQRLQAILKQLLGEKELLWYFPEEHGIAPLPAEVKSLNKTMAYRMVYDSAPMRLPLYNCIEVSDCGKIVALSLCGCSGASALVQYIKMK